MTATDIHRTIDAVWRIESARLIATLARMLRDVGLAEELAQDALVAALEKWPQEGMPANPRAWLVSAGRFKAIDGLRRRSRFDALEPDELDDRGIEVAGASCQRGARDDAAVVALVRPAEREWLAALRAWRFDAAAGRLLPVDAAGVRCRNEGFGYDG